MAESKEDKRKLLDDALESGNFNWIKEMYEHVREKQRIKIINYLKLKGFTVSLQGGHGHKDYTNDNCLGKPYDISNWKWIDVGEGKEDKKVEKKIMLSLQPFDRDGEDYHVLMDRLGIYLYKKNNGKTPEALERMLFTDIDLPMDDEKLEKLEAVLNGIFSCWNEMEEAYKTDKNKVESEYKEKCEKIGLHNTVAKKKTLFEQIFDIIKEEK